MIIPRTLLSALVCLFLALTCAPAGADGDVSSAGLPARAAVAKLAVKVPDAIEAAPGSWVAVTVKVRNTARTTARKVAVRATASQGVSLGAAKVKLARIAPRKAKTAKVWVRIDTASTAVVSIRASSRKLTTLAKTVAVSSTAPPPPGAVSAWHGNFAQSTEDGIGFTLSGDRRVITDWLAPRVFGSCTNQSGAYQFFPDTSFDSIPVDAAGSFDATRSYVDSAGYEHSVRVSGTLSGTSVGNGSLTHTANGDSTSGPAACTISAAQQTWTATQG